MNLRRPIPTAGAPAFTLLELLLAVMVFSIVMAAINSVFYSAWRLRAASARALGQAIPVQQAFAIMRHDLQGALPPSSGMIGDFRNGSTSIGQSTMQNGGLEFYTSAGVLSANQPWGDVLKVSYQLRDALGRSAGSKDLVRSVTRNVLSTTGEEPNDQVLLGGVQSVEYLCFDGSQWRNTWDTSLGDTNLPTAVRVRVQMASATGNSRNGQPLELLVPIETQSRTNAAASTEETQ